MTEQQSGLAGPVAEEGLTGQARWLGQEHRSAAATPFGDVEHLYWDEGSAWLATACIEKPDKSGARPARCICYLGRSRCGFSTSRLVFMFLHRPADLPARWAPALPFGAVGAACVVAGGLVAAAIAPTPSELGSWAAAYLVLVGGVAQVALGAGQALLAPGMPSRRLVAAELIGWNAGNGAVLIGTLLGLTPLADLGGALLFAALALIIRGMRGAARHPAWPLHLYRALVALVLVSIPVGLVIAEVRPH